MAWIEKRGKKYRVVWDVGTPKERERRTSDLMKNHADAALLRDQRNVELATGIYIEPSKMTFGQYWDHFIDLHGDKLGPKTRVSYELEAENHIKPHLGQISLPKLSALHLQEYYAFELREGKKETLERKIKNYEKDYAKAAKDNGEKSEEAKKINANLKRARMRLVKMTKEDKCGLSPTSVNYQHRIIHKALKQATKWRLIQHNAADAVDAPQPNETTMQYMKRQSVHKFLSGIKESPDHPVIADAVMTGRRQGEILGMRWSDVDFLTGIIHVNQQLIYTSKWGYEFTLPKGKKKRDIPLPLPLQGILRRVKKEQEKIKELYGPAPLDELIQAGVLTPSKAEEIMKNVLKNRKNEVQYLTDVLREMAENKNYSKAQIEIIKAAIPTGEKITGYFDLNLVYCRPDGRPLDGTGVTKRFQGLCEKHEFEKIPFHSLRHTFATLSRSAGVPLEDIQDILGHADISTTKKMYTHTEMEPLKRAMDTFAEYVDIK